MSDTPKTDAVWADNLRQGWRVPRDLLQLSQQLERELATANAKIAELQGQVERLQDDLESVTQDTDSLGVEGSNFRICHYCCAESGAGCLDNGIPHEPDCILFRQPKGVQ